MGSGASLVSKAQLKFKGPPDYWVTPKWLVHINKDGEFRPCLGLLEKLWGHKVVVNLIKSELRNTQLLWGKVELLHDSELLRYLDEYDDDDGGREAGATHPEEKISSFQGGGGGGKAPEEEYATKSVNVPGKSLIMSRMAGTEVS